MLIYTEHLKKSIRKFLKLSENTHDKVAWYNINMWKSIGFLCINIEQMDVKSSIKIPCLTVQKMEFLGLNLTNHEWCVRKMTQY